MPPATDDSISDSDSGDIPFKKPNGKSKGEAAQQKAEDDDEDDETGEDEYAVEKIVCHAFEGKKLIYEVKWVGYDETTWEPEQNLDGCPAELETYYEAVGGKPQRDGAKSRKRKASSGAPAAAAEPAAKASKGRTTAATTTKKKGKTGEGAEEEQTDTTGTHTWMVPKGSWEELVHSVETVEEGPDGKIYAFLYWHNKHKSRHATSICNIKCPQKMLAFYEGHLQFNKVPPPEPSTEEAYEDAEEEIDMDVKGVASSA